MGLGRIRLLTALCLLLVSAMAPARAADPAECVARWIAGHTAKIEGQASQLPPRSLDDATLSRLFPGHRFVQIVYRAYPVARAVPPPLKGSNVFAVDRRGGVALLGDGSALEGFFRQHLPPVRSRTDAIHATHAWLRLAAQFSQDGLLVFQQSDSDIRVTGGRAHAPRVAVGTVSAEAPSGSGALSATLTFDAKGRLTRVDEKRDIRPGRRPR